MAVNETQATLMHGKDQAAEKTINPKLTANHADTSDKMDRFGLFPCLNPSFGFLPRPMMQKKYLWLRFFDVP